MITRITVRQGEAVKVGQTLFSLRMGTATAGGESAVEAETRGLTLTRKTLQEEVARATAFIDEATRQQATMEADQSAYYGGLADQIRRAEAVAERSRATVKRVAAYVRQGDATRELLESHERTTFEYERLTSDLKLKRLELQRQDAERKRDFRNLIAAKESQRVTAQNQIEATDSRLAMLRTESVLEVQAQTAGTVSRSLGRWAIRSRPGSSWPRSAMRAPRPSSWSRPRPARSASPRSAARDPEIRRLPVQDLRHLPRHHRLDLRGRCARPRRGEGRSGLDPRPVVRQSAYRIEITPDRADVDAYGETVPVKIGSTLSVDIVVERRRLIDWMLDPIRALRGR